MPVHIGEKLKQIEHAERMLVSGLKSPTRTVEEIAEVAGIKPDRGRDR